MCNQSQNLNANSYKNFGLNFFSLKFFVFLVKVLNIIIAYHNKNISFLYKKKLQSLN